MSLQGSLETFALPDVLRLLSNTGKTGELQVKTRRSTGQLWVKDGNFVGGTVGDLTESADVLFELLRSHEGTFVFAADRPAGRPGEAQDVEFILTQVEARLVEWREIETIVPSVYVPLMLVRDVETNVLFSPDQWALVTAIGSGNTVEGLMDILTMGEFIACRSVKELVEMGVVAVGTPPDEEPLFHEPETDVSSLFSEAFMDQVPEPSEAAEAEPAKAEVEEEVAEEEPIDAEDAEAVARWEEIRKLAKIDEEGSDDEELTPEEQERAKELMEAEGEVTETESINRGLLLKFLASAQTSA